MAKIDRFFTLSFDAAKGSVTASLKLEGESEMEHELLVQFFQSRSVTLMPFHVGDSLESRFVITDPAAFANAQRATENRIRVRDGRPTVEQELALKEAKAKAIAAREAADKAAQAEGYANADDKAQKMARAAEFDELATAVAAKLQPKPAEAPKAAAKVEENPEAPPPYVPKGPVQ